MAARRRAVAFLVLLCARGVLAISTVFPARSVWGQPRDYQSAADIAAQNDLLERYGSGADVLEYNVNPDAPDYKRGRWVGCGTGRLELLQQVFGGD